MDSNIKEKIKKAGTILLNRIRSVFHIRFYSLLMLVGMLIFIMAAYGLAFIASNFAAQLYIMQRQQQNRDVLDTIYNYYSLKRSMFVTRLTAELFDEQNSFALKTMLESPNDEIIMNDYSQIKSVYDMMGSVQKLDGDVAAIYIYKTTTKNMFVYKDKGLTQVDANYPLYDYLMQDTPGIRMLNVTTIGTGMTRPLKSPGYTGITGGTKAPQPNAGNKRKGGGVPAPPVTDPYISEDNKAVTVYGFSLILSSSKYNMGHFMVAYNTGPIDKMISEYENKIYGRFLIMSDNGQVGYEYDVSSGTGMPASGYPDIGAVLKGDEHTVMDGVVYRLQIINNPDRDCIAVHMAPESVVAKGRSSDRLFIYLIFTIMAVLCAALYGASGMLSSRRVKEIGRVMKRVGSNNLAYRIPIRKNYDEYRDIAVHFNMMCDELQETINRVYVTEIKRKNAEMNALQAGINPHFLYNTLEAIKVKAAMAGADDAADMVVVLANLYRGIVKGDTFIPIRSEIEMCNLYLNILSLRYASSIITQIDVDPGIMDCGIPKILLQPILENYFMHGIKDNFDCNALHMHGYPDGGDICFCFEDNGRGIGGQQLEELQNLLESGRSLCDKGYGLLNVNQRIKLVYGQAYGLWIESVENESTKVTVRIKAMTCGELAASTGV